MKNPKTIGRSFYDFEILARGIAARLNSCLGDKKIFQNFKTSQVRFLILATVVATFARLINLSAKPPWTDEFATLIFSLGNDYSSVALNQVISLDALLQPLIPNASAKVSNIISLVIHQDNHPPLYFVLSHLWLKIFPHHGLDGLLWYSRALAAFFGLLSVPAIYLIVRALWPGLLLAQLSAILMAFSPYAIFLAQEARQYSMAILLVLLSLGCLLKAIKETVSRGTFPWWLVGLWTIVNTLGLLVHYFFILTLIAELLSLVVFYLRYGLSLQAIQKLSIVILATSAAGLSWLYLVIPHSYGQSMTSWIHRDNTDFFSLFKPFFQILATWITMLCLLPVESPNLLIVIVSGLLMGWFLLWSIPPIYKNIQKAKSSSSLVEFVLIFILSSIAIFFFLTYFAAIDITRGARYSFVYFPAVIILIGVGLIKFKGKDLALIFSVGFLSALTVTCNLGYQKYYRPDLLVPILQQNSDPKITRVIASPYKSLVEIGEMMSIAWVLKKENILLDSKFFLVKDPALTVNLNSIGTDYDLWLMNFKDLPTNLPNCINDGNKYPLVNGYQFAKYHCKSISSQSAPV